jgi:cadmium resistance protein CadD (predicted permease)
MFFALYRVTQKRKEVVIGQYLGMGTIIFISVIISYTIGKLDLFELKWLGVIPILLGVKTFFEKSEDEETLEKISQVAFLTLLNGTDNIVVYVSLFSPLSVGAMFLSIIIFLIMTAFWCLMAMKLVSHKGVSEKLIKYKRYLVPVVLIYVGLNMLFG